jgi:hypothetical protein
MLKNIFIFITLMAIFSCHSISQKPTITGTTDTTLLDTIYKFLDLPKSHIISSLDFKKLNISVNAWKSDMRGIDYSSKDTLHKNIAIEGYGFCLSLSCIKNICKTIFVYPKHNDLFEVLLHKYSFFYYLDVDQFLSKDNKSRFEIVKPMNETPYFVFTLNK